MTVLLLTPSAPPALDGIAELVGALSRGLGAGFALQVLARGGPPGGRLGALAFALRCLTELWRRRGSFELIHVMGGYLYSLPALLLGRLLGTPVIVHYQGGELGEAPSILWRARLAAQRRWASAMLALTEEAAQKLRRAGCPPRRLRVVANPVDRRRFVPADEGEKASLRRRLGLGPGVVALYLGRLAAQKNLELLLEAAAGLPMTVVLVGDGELGPRLRARGAALGCAARFHPATPSPEDWLRAADLLALPSLYEGLSLALLESMACGLPAVLTPAAAPARWVEDRVTALVAAPRPEPWRSALAALAQDEGLRRRLGRAALSRSREADDPETWAGRIGAVYREVDSSR